MGVVIVIVVVVIVVVVVVVGEVVNCQASGSLRLSRTIVATTTRISLLLLAALCFVFVWRVRTEQVKIGVHVYSTLIICK